MRVDSRLGSLLLVFLAVCLLTGCRPVSHRPKELSSDHLFKPTGGEVISSPLVADLDGDGLQEIAVGSWDGNLYVVNSWLEDLPGWPKYSRKGFFSSPASGDLDRDGRFEILVGSEAGKLFAWHVDGRAVEGFPVDLGYPIWASPTVLAAGWVAVGDQGRMLMLDAGGRHVPGWPQEMEGWPDATAAWAPGLIAVTTLTPGDPSLGRAYAWREDGTLLPGYPVELPLDSDSSPALAQLDGDGAWWILFGDDAGWLHVLDGHGRERSGFPVRAWGPVSGPTPTPHPPGGNAWSIEASPSVADVDGDGGLDIVVGSWDGRMYVWDDRGELLPGWPQEAGDQIISSAALADLDGDDLPDVIAGSKDGRLYGWRSSGEGLPGFSYDLGAPVFSSPWVGDLDNDGRADVVVGANNGIHVLYDVGVWSKAPWPTFRQNNQRTGALP